MLRKIYLSSIGVFLSIILNVISVFSAHLWFTAIETVYLDGFAS
jgi:hypothetical protein